MSKEIRYKTNGMNSGQVRGEYCVGSRGQMFNANVTSTGIGSIYRNGHTRLHNSTRLLRNPLIHADIN